MLDTLVNYQSPPFGSPFSAQALLADAIVAANLPYEGLWIPLKWARNTTVELTGSLSTVTCDIWGTNQQAPVNTYVLTLTGSETDGDVLTLTFKNPLLPTGSRAVSITAAGGVSETVLAAALAAAVAADAQLAPLGFLATSSGAVVTITWPSVPGNNASTSVGSPPFGSSTILNYTVNGAATETGTITLGADGTNLTPSHLTAKGLVAVTPMPVNFIKARVTVLTGSNATMSVGMSAAA